MKKEFQDKNQDKGSQVVHIKKVKRQNHKINTATFVTGCTRPAV